jgi:hypothetical protein
MEDGILDSSLILNALPFCAFCAFLRLTKLVAAQACSPMGGYAEWSIEFFGQAPFITGFAVDKLRVNK